MLRAMAWTRRALVTVALAVPLAGCVKQAEPDPAEIRTTVPPWPAPRDAISYIDLAGLQRLPLDASDDPHVLVLEVFVEGQSVEVPAYVGVDRLRAVQAACHTHDTSGTVWLEGAGSHDVTLGQFFDVIPGSPLLAAGQLARRDRGSQSVVALLADRKDQQV